MARPSACRPDPTELAKYRSRPAKPAATIRFAFHVQERDPTNIWASMALPKYAFSLEERLAMLQGALQAGLRRWLPERQGRMVRWWDEPETRATAIHDSEPVWGGILGCLANDRLPAFAVAGAVLVVASVITSELMRRRVGAAA